MRLVLRLEAKGDLREAFNWYEERQPGLGRSFRASVESILSSIREHPAMYPRVDPSIRRAATDRFPFGIFYRIDGETIRVIAILHNARNPEHWRGRT
jgi:toxin ParE1/3/4